MGCFNSKIKIEPDANMHEWDYSDTKSWADFYPSANGLNQSPIDIISSLSEYDETLKISPFEFDFDLNCFIELKNNGRTFVASAAGDTSSISGGFLPNSYKFSNFHMHWGLNESTGSEHYVDGGSFAAELHFVFWNDSKYSSFETAVQSNNHDGLAIFAVFVIVVFFHDQIKPINCLFFFEVGTENEEFGKITAAIDNIKLLNKSTFISRPIELKKFLPGLKINMKSTKI